MSSTKLQNHEKKLSIFWERVVVLCKKKKITESEFRKQLGISSSYLTELKWGRAKATGGKIWHAVRREFPDWEDYLRDGGKTPPTTLKDIPSLPTETLKKIAALAPKKVKNDLEEDRAKYVRSLESRVSEQELLIKQLTQALAFLKKGIEKDQPPAGVSERRKVYSDLKKLINWKS